MPHRSFICRAFRRLLLLLMPLWALLVLLATLQGCTLYIPRRVTDGAEWTIDEALAAHVRALSPDRGSLVTLIRQPWSSGRLLLYRFTSTAANGQRSHHLGFAFAQRSGMLGWRLQRDSIVTYAAGRPPQVFELHVDSLLAPGTKQVYTSFYGQVNVPGARRIRVIYSDGATEHDLMDGYFLDVHEEAHRANAIVALDEQNVEIARWRP